MPTDTASCNGVAAEGADEGNGRHGARQERAHRAPDVLDRPLDNPSVYGYHSAAVAVCEIARGGT